MTDPLLDAIDARIDAKLVGLSHAVYTLSEYADRHKEQIWQLDARIAALEPKPQPVPEPTIKQRLTVRDGKLWEGDKEFRELTVTLAAYFFRSKLDAIEAELVRLKSLGYRLVRLHHWALNQWGRYVPTYADCEAALPRLAEVIALCEKHGLYVWLTCQHQQRLEKGEVDTPLNETMWGPGRTDPANGDGGVAFGEVHDLLFWSDPILDYVELFILKLVRRFPNVAMITLWNEKFAARSNGQWIGDRSKQILSAYQKCYFDKFTKYEQAMGGIVADTQKSGMLEFQCWVGHQAAKRVVNSVRAAGYKGIISVSETYGIDSANMATLIEQSAGDVIGFHLYQEKDGPDPFLDNDTRTFSSVSRAMHLKGYPLVCGEFAPVNQSNSQKSGSWGLAARYAATRGHELDLLVEYAGHSSGVPDGKADVYSYLKHPEGASDLADAKQIFGQEQFRNPEYRQLTREDVFGFKPKSGDYVPPPIPGDMNRQPWSKEVGGVLPPDLGWA